MNIVATVEIKPITRYGRTLLSTAALELPLDPPAVPVEPAADPEREPDAPLPEAAAPDAVVVAKMLSVATAAKSCSDE